MGQSPRHLPLLRLRRGFTVVEVMIVLLIMSIIAVLAIDAISGFEANQRADRAARESLAAFRYARTLAMTTGKTTKVSVNTTTGNIAVYWMSNGTSFDTTPAATGLTATG